MSDVRELYQQMILDHGRKPRRLGKLDDPSFIQEGFNPLCGDHLTLYIKEKDDRIIDVSFDGDGCAISMASASLMSEALIGLHLDKANDLFEAFHQMILQPHDGVETEMLGKLIVLKGVTEYPARVKCATLAWQTLKSALKGDKRPVSTES